MVINFDQTPLSYFIIGNTTLEFSGMQSVPVKGKGKGKQITGTFNIITAGKFLHMQLYTEETQHCYPKGILFADGFDVTTPKNDWNNETLAIQCVIPSTFITSSFRTLKRCVKS